MRVGQRCTHRRNYIGYPFGELKVIADIGNQVRQYSYGKRTIPLLKLTCRKGHTEQRNAVSLRVSGDKARCKQCRKVSHGS